MAKTGKWNSELGSLLVPVEELEEDPENVREHNDRNIEAIKYSFSEFGQQKPIVALKDGTVIAGNGSLVAVRELGWTHIAAIRFDHNDALKARAFALADNRTAELAEWDQAMLLEQLDALDDIPDFDLVLTGFTGIDLEELRGTFGPGGADDQGALDTRINVTITCPQCGHEIER